MISGPGSSVNIATGYGLDGTEIESRRGRGAKFFAHVQNDPGAHPASCIIGTGSILGVKRPGRDADHTPPSELLGHRRVQLYVTFITILYHVIARDTKIRKIILRLQFLDLQTIPEIKIIGLCSQCCLKGRVHRRTVHEDSRGVEV
jgi:hypothetical protein